MENKLHTLYNYSVDNVEIYDYVHKTIYWEL